MHYIILITLILQIYLLSFSPFALSQSEKTNDRLAFIGGMGNYEYLHAGLKLPVQSVYYFETAVGINPLNRLDEKYVMGYLSLGTLLLKEKYKGVIHPFLQLKALFWNLENNYNRFLMLGIGPEVGVNYKLNTNFGITCNGGGIYNTLLYYERKTDLEVGWPKNLHLLSACN